jgi:hypothetical protein
LICSLTTLIPLSSDALSSSIMFLYLSAPYKCFAIATIPIHNLWLETFLIRLICLHEVLPVPGGPWKSKWGIFLVSTNFLTVERVKGESTYSWWWSRHVRWYLTARSVCTSPRRAAWWQSTMLSESAITSEPRPWSISILFTSRNYYL